VQAEFHLACRIGLYGGTFDPPHAGHLISAQIVAETLNLSKVIFLPAGQPPHKTNLAITPVHHRLKMVELAIADNPRFELCDWETRQPGPNYTIQTVRHFQELMQPNNEFYWIIGADSLADLPKWFEFESLIETVSIATAFRGGFEIERIFEELKPKLSPAHLEKLRKNLVKTPMIEIAAHELRSRVQRGLGLRYFVPPSVEDYINKEGLYR
jgi:nicotinate-nucleotide adenylyltransferase